MQRQIAEWEATGDLGRKSTFGWDDQRSATFLQRVKEEANDYRYFPDPDLAPVHVDQAWLTELKTQIGELPMARRKRYVDALGLSAADAATLAGDRATGEFYEQAIAAGGDAKRVGNLILSHGRRLSNEKSLPLGSIGIAPQRFAEIATLIDQNKISVSSAGPLFDRLATKDAPPTNTPIEALAGELGLLQVSDSGEIDAAIDALIAANPKPLQDYKAGKASAIGALVGMVMKNAKGLNPKMVQESLKRKLGS